MAVAGKQVINGKAFEYAIAFQYYNFLSADNIPVELFENDAFRVAKNYYLSLSDKEREQFDLAAYNTIYTLIKIEPGLTESSHANPLIICLNEDNAGELGDVRDIVFKRNSPKWEIGVSAKNNNDAIKHSRLGKDLDFGYSWLGVKCSNSYWESIDPIFNYIEGRISENKKWSDLGKDKEEKVYVPLLEAFKEELLQIAHNYPDIPQKLISYLIGKKPFYKFIKDDNHNLVVVKAFNIAGGLNKNYVGHKSAYVVPKVNLPTRIVEFNFKKHSTTTLNMILDNGWEISFRIHNASTYVERSLKLDIQLLGNPPILFTQYIFQ